MSLCPMLSGSNCFKFDPNIKGFNSWVSAPLRGLGFGLHAMNFFQFK
jgi:hypothetical protein